MDAVARLVARRRLSAPRRRRVGVVNAGCGSHAIEGRPLSARSRGPSRFHEAIQSLPDDATVGGSSMQDAAAGTPMTIAAIRYAAHEPCL